MELGHFLGQPTKPARSRAEKPELMCTTVPPAKSRSLPRQLPPRACGRGGRKPPDQQPQRCAHTPEAETDPFHQGTGDQSRGDDCEHTLKEREAQSWNGQPIPDIWHVLQHCRGEGIANHSVQSTAIGEGKTESEEVGGQPFLKAAGESFEGMNEQQVPASCELSTKKPRRSGA